MLCKFKPSVQPLSSFALHFAVCTAGIHSNGLRVLCRPSKRACGWNPLHCICAISDSPRHKAHWLGLACRAWRWQLHLCQDCHQVVYGFRSICFTKGEARVCIYLTVLDMKGLSYLTAGSRILSVMFLHSRSPSMKAGGPLTRLLRVVHAEVSAATFCFMQRWA